MAFAQMSDLDMRLQEIGWLSAKKLTAESTFGKYTGLHNAESDRCCACGSLQPNACFTHVAFREFGSGPSSVCMLSALGVGGG
jgi:hypothetical protein